MTKKKFLLAMSLLLAGAGMHAQSGSSGQMDERFTDGKLPYGWFTEGWTVKDNAAQSSSGSGGFDIGSLMGGAKSRYLLTPPLNVLDGDSLAFSVKKSGMSFSIGGGADSLIVEKSVYGSGEWETVTVLKDTLASSYRPFAIKNVAAGEYRFRFTTSASLALDSVAGHTIDMDAPDLYVTLDSAVVSEVNLGGNMKKDSTVTFIVMNTGTGTLNLDITSSNETLFALSANQLSVAAGDSATLGVTFKYVSDSIGRHNVDITFAPADNRLKAQTVKFTAGIVDPGMWLVDFNDGKMPYGCFTEGWALKDSANVQSGSSSGGFDLSSLLGGSSSADNYLLTPPLKVEKENEPLVFSAKSGGSGIGSLLGGGGSTTFFVDRAVYGTTKWLQVAEFTDSLGSDYKELAVTTEEPGEYRFRFRAASGVTIDSIAGGKIDIEAPDLLVTVDSIHAHTVDLGVVTADSVKQFVVINTATGTLNLDIASSGEGAFSLSDNHFDIAAGDSAVLNVSFNYAAAHTGRNETAITFTPADERVEPQTINVTAVLEDLMAWHENFNDSIMPTGWFTDGWVAKDSVVTLSSGSGSGIGSMLGGSSKAYFLETPPLIVTDETEAMTFFVKKGSGGLDLGSLLGGSGTTLTVERSVYGSNRWEKIKEISDITTDFKQQWVSYAEPGEYRFRFVASDSLVIDSVAGYTLDTNGPDINVIQNDALVSQLYFGMPKDTATQTITLINTGTGTLDVNIGRSNEIIFEVSSDNVHIAAGDSVDVDVTFVYNESQLGEHNETLFVTPQHEALAEQQISLLAYSIYTDAWTEDFEPKFVIDKPDVAELPEGWETTGWEVSMPSGSLDLGSLLGGGDDSNTDKNETYAASSTSDDYELVTPMLQAKKGDVLGFELELTTTTGNAIGSLLGEDTSETSTLNVYYSKDNGQWTPCGQYSANGNGFFTAPYSGIYRLMFKGKDIRLDNFIGFRLPLEEVALVDSLDNGGLLEKFDTLDVNVNVKYDRTLAAIQQADGTWLPRAYIVSLPYDYNITDYYEDGLVNIYRLRFKEEYYRQFVFMKDDSQLMKAGMAYLVVVNQGSMNMNAVDVKLTNEVVSDSTVVVDSFEDWYFEDKFTPVGKWLANFRSISDVEADTLNIYGMRSDGTWARFQSEGGVEKNRLMAFRGYFEADAPADAPAGARMNAPAAPGTYKTQFQSIDNQGVSMGESVNYDNMDYEAVIPYIQGSTTGICPAIVTIEGDGSSRYFDLQGRMLNGKPQKGMYIHNGKKALINN